MRVSFRTIIYKLALSRGRTEGDAWFIPLDACRVAGYNCTSVRSCGNREVFLRTHLPLRSFPMTNGVFLHTNLDDVIYDHLPNYGQILGRPLASSSTSGLCPGAPPYEYPFQMSASATLRDIRDWDSPEAVRSLAHLRYLGEHLQEPVRYPAASATSHDALRDFAIPHPVWDSPTVRVGTSDTKASQTDRAHRNAKQRTAQGIRRFSHRPSLTVRAISPAYPGSFKSSPVPKPPTLRFVLQAPCFDSTRSYTLI